MGLFRANPARKQAAEMARLRKALAKSGDPDSPQSLQLRHRLGLLLVETADWPAAEEHYTELADAQLRVAGDRDPGTLGAWANLAVAQAAQGRVDDGVHLLESTVEVYEDAIGADDPATLQVQVMLAEMLSLAGDYDGALDVLDRHRAACEHRFGPGHEQTVAAGHRMVAVLRTLGRFKQAEELHDELSADLHSAEERDAARAVSLLIKAESGRANGVRTAARLLVERRPTADSVEALASVLRHAGEPAEAAELYRQLVAAHGPGSPRTWGLAAELARAYLESGQLDEAEQLTGELLESRGLPDLHPITLGVRATSARVARERGRNADRELAAVVAGFEEVFGPEHPDTVEAAGWLKKD
ncbi:tetratricopeptide repeat protein [Amycolatopsis jejuensis]|uniref:tetratricopeptide repeat protein n=1 Tax=Amycolatopsis jejuensis TaxID=330084 RepID=UPI00052563DD|nr:tetratricopeptide repeat protein [Amycolatopsis jejuensis]